MTAPEHGFGPQSIRAMELEDLDAVQAIENAAQLTPWSTSHFRDCITNANYLCQVVTRDDDPVAFLILSRILDETHVLNVVVAPAWQRRGIARLMLEQAMDQARKDAMSVMYLEVRESNTGAQVLYRQLGFDVCGVRKNYYRKGDGHENAVLMQCLLSGGHK
ncbi:ribosomal protein S18-alanine N-acetyltransferase [Alcanivorax sp. DP30]|uniref:ribosomal protein S18-alanine N-acetyltransferase n=1 Tax=Alcanivorax sp. DP30 TaxID=2606217 RepID=UPI001F0087D3|nr:ribosomal protein S18-alanine N-acetyltransferase [Alcanivorax sp. DP30]